MPKRPDDQWPAGDPALAAFAEDLRIIAGGPAPDPRPGLVSVMRQGTPVPTGPPAGRRNMLVKAAIGSLAAKVALGMGVAAASVTAVGATGSLPEPAQRVVASVVEATTPFALPDPSDVAIPEPDDDATSKKSVAGTGAVGDAEGGDAEGGDGGGGDGGGERTVNHGACVSAAARDKSEPGSHGKTVASIARSDCGKTTDADPTPSTTVVPTTSTSTSSTTTSSTTLTAEQRSANSGRGNSGRGNNGTTGNGPNSGRGGSGNN